MILQAFKWDKFLYSDERFSWKFISPATCNELKNYHNKGLNKSKIKGKKKKKPLKQTIK